MSKRNYLVFYAQSLLSDQIGNGTGEHTEAIVYKSNRVKGDAQLGLLFLSVVKGVSTGKITFFS